MTVRSLVAAALLALLMAAVHGAEPPPLPEVRPASDAAEQTVPPPLPGPPPVPVPPKHEQAPEPPPPPSGVEPIASEKAGRVGLLDRLDAGTADLPVPLHGFLETRVGPRVRDAVDDLGSFSLAETRLQLESDPYWQEFQFNMRADLVYDLVLSEGRVDLREAAVAFSPFSFMDVKAGRQILTWGTGDLLFINDLFPKDYVSFFIGRDVEYLKAPSDAAKVSVFSEVANLDLVYTPQFDPDTFVTGRRLSYYNPLTGDVEGEDVRIRTRNRSSWFDDDEIALRLYRSIGSYEAALYGYSGYWKQPLGMDPGSGLFTFPRLAVYGASVRGPVAGGIGSAEFGRYTSLDDWDGTDPFLPNSQWRFMTGYSQDLPRVARDLTVGVQYYLEVMDDYGNYERSLPGGAPAADRDRHTLTLRLTKLLMNQDLRLGLFGFWGLNDQDLYLRPHVSYDITDRWRVDGGANIFLGDRDDTQFGQLEENSNVYFGVRYSF